MRRLSLRLCGLALLMACVTGASAQTAWPERPVRVIVPFPASGATDLVARVVAQRVSADLGQQMVIDNKPGAGGTIGAAEAAKAPADGYTLLFTTSSTHAISPHLMPRLAYDARIPQLPNLPTFFELGLKEYKAVTWLGMVAPTGTPPEVITKLNSEINRLLQTPEIKQRMIDAGAFPMGGTPAKMTEAIKAELTKWAKVVKYANIALE